MIRSAVYVAWTRHALGAALLLRKATRTMRIGKLVYDSRTLAWQCLPSDTVLTSALESLGEEALFPREVGKYVELAYT